MASSTGTGKPVQIGVFTGSRAEYGLLYPVIKALHEAPDLDLQLYVSGAHLDPAYGKTVSEIDRDGFPIAARLPIPNVGRNMALDTAEVTRQLAELFSSNKPDCLIVLGDRYELLGVVNAAFLYGVPIAHIHGGDVVGAGAIDDAIRHAITKLAHLHFPATQQSAERILKMGEEPWRVHIAGSPVLDNLKLITEKNKAFFADTYGLNPDKKWALFTMHPLTAEPQNAGTHAKAVLNALEQFSDELEILVTYPNQDEGSAAIIEVLKVFENKPGFHVVPSLGRENYLNFLRHTDFVIGNSSSGLLETAHFKIPCVNVGTRQHGRERGQNVVDVAQEETTIANAIDKLLHDAPFKASLQRGEHPFGEGRHAEIVLGVLRQTDLKAPKLLQKQITY